MNGKRPSWKVLQARKLKRLEGPEIKRWYHNVARGSLLTVDAYLRTLFLFSDRLSTNSHAILKLKDRALHGLILDLVIAEEDRGGAAEPVAAVRMAG